MRTHQLFWNRARGSWFTKTNEQNSMSKIMRYPKQTRILLFFRGNLTHIERASTRFQWTLGGNIARAIDLNTASKIWCYQTKKKDFTVFQTKHDSELINSFERARGSRFARAFELNSESKIIRYLKQKRISLFFRRNLKTIGAELKTRGDLTYYEL